MKWWNIQDSSRIKSSSKFNRVYVPFLPFSWYDALNSTLVPSRGYGLLKVVRWSRYIWLYLSTCFRGVVRIPFPLPYATNWPFSPLVSCSSPTTASIGYTDGFIPLSSTNTTSTNHIINESVRLYISSFELRSPIVALLVPTPFASHVFSPLDNYLQSVPYHLFIFLFPSIVSCTLFSSYICERLSHLAQYPPPDSDPSARSMIQIWSLAISSRDSSTGHWQDLVHIAHEQK